MAIEKDLNVGANLYPTESGVAELGNSTNKWKIDGSQLTGTVVASQIGTATVGGTAKPVYMNAGTVKACSATVGGTAKPVYMNAGTITASSSTIGSATQPVYMNAGTITATTYTLSKSVPSNAVFTDTDTHYTSKNVVGTSTATSNTTTALTNGNVYLNSVENGAVTSAHKISGSGATTVTSDTSGNIVISSTNTTYSSLKNPNALTISLNGTSQGAYDGSAAKSINITASSVGAAASSHTHDDYLPLSGGSLTGDVTLTWSGSNPASYITTNSDTGNSVSLKVGSGKVNRGLYDETKSRWMVYANSSGSVILNGNATTATSATSATTATQLSTSAGSATQPVYFSGGKPVACSYTIAKSVPSNAVFTDTNTWTALEGSTTSAAGTAGYAPAPAAGAATRYLRCDGTWTVPPDTNTTYSAATTSAQGLVKIGSNITVSSGTISLTKANVTSALGYTPPTTNTTYSVATTSANGLMSSADKSKLDNLIVVSSTQPTSSDCKIWIKI